MCRLINTLMCHHPHSINLTSHSSPRAHPHTAIKHHMRLMNSPLTRATIPFFFFFLLHPNIFPFRRTSLISQRARTKPPLRLWMANGWMCTCPGTTLCLSSVHRVTQTVRGHQSDGDRGGWPMDKFETQSGPCHVRGAVGAHISIHRGTPALLF